MCLLGVFIMLRMTLSLSTFLGTLKKGKGIFVVITLNSAWQVMDDQYIQYL